jgi:hypothetical protein
MHRKLLVALGLAIAFSTATLTTGVLTTGALTTGALASGAEFAGPGPGVTGNDTGGIFPYSPGVETVYQQIADDHCARWARLAKVTSIHRKYGDYVSFVCYDRPGRIH